MAEFREVRRSSLLPDRIAADIMAKTSFKHDLNTMVFMHCSGPQGSVSEVPRKMASGKLSGRLWDPPGRPSGP